MLISVQHLSLRLVWHDRGWDGCVCDRPDLNVYCQGQFSVQGDFIKEEKDVDWELKHKGQTCAEIYQKQNRIPPCTWTIGAFSKLETPHIHIHPFFDNAKPRPETFPEFSAGTWAMDQMYDPRTKQLVPEFEQREQNIKSYFDRFVEGKSLVFFYVNYDNPLNSDDKKYVLVGISRLKKFGPSLTFEGLNEWQLKTSGNRVWSRYVQHEYDEGRGVRIPYQAYLKAGKTREEIAPILVEITGELARRFKYVTRPLSDDDACELIQRTIESIRRVKKDGIVKEDWDAHLEWLNEILGTTWTDRGLYPGLGSVLEVLGMRDGTTFVKDLTSKKTSEDLRSYIFDSLNSGNPPEWAAKVGSVWHQYSDAKQKILRRLCSFDLTKKQMDKIVSEKRDETGIESSLEAIVGNPYIISEEYKGEDEDDVIGFYRIDNGLLPYGLSGKQPEIDLEDSRRIRALMIEKLNSDKNNTGHCFLDLSDIIEYVEDSQADWRKCSPTFEKVMAERTFYEQPKKLAFFEHEGRKFVYLRQLLGDEKIVHERIEKMLPKTYAESEKIDWKQRLTLPHEPIPDDVYQKVLEQQAAAVQNSFLRKLSVITGAAGTGKTTILRTLIPAIKTQKPGASFLLLAPTGKARENLAHKTGMLEETMTIHRALMKHGWLSKKSYRFVENKKKMIEASNIIIDEASMVDLELLAHLFRAIQWAVVERLIIVGDANQLPPIGFGRPFFDIVDYLQKNHEEAIKHLTINCRQLIQQTNVLKLASLYTESPDKDFDALLNKIEKGEELGDDLETVFWDEQKDLYERLHERLKNLLEHEGIENGKDNLSIEALLDIRLGSVRGKPSDVFSIDYFQILSPYRGEYFGTSGLNLELQTKYRQKEISWLGFLEGFTTGDKIIQVRNTTIYTKQQNFDVYNGELGYVHYVPGPGKKRFGINVNFTDSQEKIESSVPYAKKIIDRNLELGYAITIHKSQGSEFDIVFLVLPREETRLISRELIYTALTRSRKKLVLFLQKDIRPLLTASSSGKSAIRLRNTSLFDFRFSSEKYRFNDLIHRTSKGDYVRSKSEVIIANYLWDHDVFYKYEEPLWSKDRTEWRLPDFTIKLEEGGTYFWEHLGRLGTDPQYTEDWEDKKKWYERNGYVSMLITSNEIGGFDSKKIEQIAKDNLGIA